MAQIVERRLGIFEIGQVEALGEPIVDFREYCARLISTIGVA
jgi:hypothetical protein